MILKMYIVNILNWKNVGLEKTFVSCHEFGDVGILEGYCVVLELKVTVSINKLMCRWKINKNQVCDVYKIIGNFSENSPKIINKTWKVNEYVIQ